MYVQAKDQTNEPKDRLVYFTKHWEHLLIPTEKLIGKEAVVVGLLSCLQLLVLLSSFKKPELCVRLGSPFVRLLNINIILSKGS